MKQTSAIFLSLAALLLFLPGISCSKQSATGLANGGVFVSADQGDTWSTRNQAVLNGKQIDLSRQQILDLKTDPRDANILFVATAQYGLLKSSDQGKSWSFLTTAGQIQHFDISRDQNTLLAARFNQVFLTKDGGKVWNLVYTDPDAASVVKVAFDPSIASRLYVALSHGQIIRSLDSGKTWTTLKTFPSPLQHFAIHSTNGSVLYAATSKEGLWRSKDAGSTWVALTEAQKTNKTGLGVTQLALHPTDTTSLLMATKDGLFESSDSGNVWRQLTLLSGKQHLITSLLWNPQDRRSIYYSTSSLIYRSEDGGASWTPIPSPARAIPKVLFMDPGQKVLLLGTQKP